MGGWQFRRKILDNPDPIHGPVLIGTCIEDASLPTVLIYGHGDVVRAMPERWRPGLDPWTLTIDGDRAKALAIAGGHQTYRLRNLGVGDAALYDLRGAYVWLTAGGPSVACAGNPMTIAGDLHVTGAVIAGYGGADQVGLQTHKHGEGTAAAGTTAPAAEAAAAGAREARQIRPGSIADLVTRYRASPDYAQHKPATRLDYEKGLKPLERDWGTCPWPASASTTSPPCATATPGAR